MRGFCSPAPGAPVFCCPLTNHPPRLSDSTSNKHLSCSGTCNLGGAGWEQLTSAPRSVCWAGWTGGFQDGSLTGLAPWHWVFSQGHGPGASLPPHVGLSSSQAALAPTRHSGWLPRANIPGDRKWQLPVSEDLDPDMGTAPRLLYSFIKWSQGRFKGKGDRSRLSRSGGSKDLGTVFLSFYRGRQIRSVLKGFIQTKLFTASRHS